MKTPPLTVPAALIKLCWELTHLKVLCSRVQRILHQVRVVTGSLQQHEDVLQLQVDLSVQWALDIQHSRGAEGGRGQRELRSNLTGRGESNTLI